MPTQMQTARNKRLANTIVSDTLLPGEEMNAYLKTEPIKTQKRNPLPSAYLMRRTTCPLTVSPLKLKECK